MLRLCHDLPRYSVDLDFWFSKEIQEDTFFSRLEQNLDEDYEITDARMKHSTLLLELRSASYPRRLKKDFHISWKTSTPPYAKKATEQPRVCA